MAIEQEQNKNVATAAEGAPGAPQTQSGTAGSPQGEPIDGDPNIRRGADGNVHVIGDSTFAKIRDTERAKGRKEGATFLAQELGYESIDAFKAELAELKNKTAKAPVAPLRPTGKKPGEQVPGAAPVLSAAERREQETLAKKYEAAAKKQDEYRTKYETTQAQLEKRETEMALYSVAAKAGATDLEYVTTLMLRSLASADDKALAEFGDGTAFLAKLRGEKPFLFGERVVPADTTGEVVAGEPKPPKARDLQQPGKPFNVKNLNPQEYQAYKKSLGLKNSTQR